MTIAAKYLLPTASALIALLVWGAWQYDRTAQYRRGKADAAAEISAALAQNERQKAEADREKSLHYQKTNALLEQKERVKYVQMVKTIERPVYRNVCLDADGVQIVNAAIAE